MTLIAVVIIFILGLLLRSFQAIPFSLFNQGGPRLQLSGRTKQRYTNSLYYINIFIK